MLTTVEARASAKVVKPDAEELQREADETLGASADDPLG